jgi:hypothetical protein
MIIEYRKIYYPARQKINYIPGVENKPKELILVDLAVMLNDEVLKHKLFYEPVKPKPVIVAEKGCLYMDNDEKYSLDGYSEHQRENWANSDITIYEDET